MARVIATQKSLRSSASSSPASLGDVLQDVVRPAEDKNLLGFGPLKFLLDKPSRMIHDRCIVVRDFVHVGFSALVAENHPLLGHLLLVASDQRGPRLHNHGGGKGVYEEDGRGRGGGKGV